jgi:SAM-dependent methyltransferase
MSHGPAIFTPSYYERLEILERRHWWCRSVRRVALGLIERLAPDARIVLDAGCGTGGFLAALSARRLSVRGVGADVSLDALERARGNGVGRLMGASVVELPVGSGKVDLLVSNDVLQHLPEGADRRAVAEAYRVLRPGGFFCLRSNLGVPIASSPALHQRYDRAVLSRLIDEAGFSILEHVVLHPLARLWSDLRRAGESEHSDGQHGLALTLPSPPVNVAMDLYTRFEDAVVRRRPFRSLPGDAQIVFAQKPERA